MGSLRDTKKWRLSSSKILDRTIAKIDTVLFVTGLILFQLFNIPITEADSVPMGWFDIIYWATLISASILSGMMAVVMLMLYNTVTNLIHIVGIGKDHQLILDDESRKDKKESSEIDS